LDPLDVDEDTSDKSQDQGTAHEEGNVGMLDRSMMVGNYGVHFWNPNNGRLIPMILIEDDFIFPIRTNNFINANLFMNTNDSNNDFTEIHIGNVEDDFNDLQEKDLLGHGRNPSCNDFIESDSEDSNLHKRIFHDCDSFLAASILPLITTPLLFFCINVSTINISRENSVVQKVGNLTIVVI